MLHVPSYFYVTIYSRRLHVCRSHETETAYVYYVKAKLNKSTWFFFQVSKVESGYVPEVIIGQSHHGMVFIVITFLL